MRYLILLLLCGSCIPFGAFINTDKPRSGIWAVEGHTWTWHVDQPDVVRAACAPGGPHGCVRWVPFEATGEIWTVDSAAMAKHECKHALGFSRAKTQADIDAEVNHTGESGMVGIFWTGGPAREKLCE